MLKKDALREAINDYVENYSIEANLRPKTIQNKRGCFNRFLLWIGDKPYILQVVREYLLYLNRKGLKASSLMDETRMFRALTNFLFKRGHIKENFATEIVKPKVPDRPFTFVAPEVVLKIIDAGVEIGNGDRSRSKFYKSEVKLALNFVMRTGLRINEIVQLKGSDLNLDDNPPTYWVNSKGGNINLLPLPRDMVDVLRERIGYERLFIVTEKLCNEVLRRGCEKLSIGTKLTCHDLRRIFGTSLAKNKVLHQFTQRLMRHKNIETTNKYYTFLDITDLSLALNSAQTIVREGLKESEIFDMVTSAVKSTGINNDGRYDLSFKKSGNVFRITLRRKSLVAIDS